MSQHSLQTSCALQMYVQVLIMDHSIYCIKRYSVAGEQTLKCRVYPKPYLRCVCDFDTLTASTAKKQLTQVCASWFQSCPKEAMEAGFSSELLIRSLLPWPTWSNLERHV